MKLILSDLFSITETQLLNWAFFPKLLNDSFSRVILQLYPLVIHLFLYSRFFITSLLMVYTFDTIEYVRGGTQHNLSQNYCYFCSWIHIFVIDYFPCVLLYGVMNFFHDVINGHLVRSWFIFYLVNGEILLEIE